MFRKENCRSNYAEHAKPRDSEFYTCERWSDLIDSGFYGNLEEIYAFACSVYSMLVRLRCLKQDGRNF